MDWYSIVKLNQWMNTKQQQQQHPKHKWIVYIFIENGFKDSRKRKEEKREREKIFVQYCNNIAHTHTYLYIKIGKFIAGMMINW